MNFTTHIITHDGQFHADEVTAIALITLAEGRGLDNYHISRTRKNLDNMQGMFIDVGGIYDPSKNRFDHHQFESELSSAGMIWKELGSTFGKDLAQVDAFVKAVDDQDFGRVKHGSLHYCNLISAFNSDEVYGDSQDNAFRRAVEFAMQVITNLIRKNISFNKQVEAAAEYVPIVSSGVRIIVMPKEAMYIGTYFFIGRADALISWDDEQQCWTLVMVGSERDSFATLYSIHSAENHIFIHIAKFLAKLHAVDGLLKFTLSDKGTQETVDLSIAV